jgi:hypothetical protein
MPMLAIGAEDPIQERQLLPGRTVIAKPFNDFTLVEPFTILQTVTGRPGQAFSQLSNGVNRAGDLLYEFSDSIH